MRNSIADTPYTSQGFSEAFYGFIDGLAGELKGTEVHGDALSGCEFLVDTQRFFGIHMRFAHEPSWFVGPSW